jgi:hypothetical protein
MIQNFGISGSTRIINAAGQSFRYESGAAQGASLAITVRADGQQLGEFLPGDMVRIPFSAVQWEIVPASSALSGVVRIGPSTMDTTRVSGEVELVPASFRRAMRHQAFQRFFRAGGWTAIPEFQLWNPANSGRALIVNQVESYASNSYVDLWLYAETAAWATPSGYFWSKRNGARHDTVGSLMESRIPGTGRGTFVAPTNPIWTMTHDGMFKLERTFEEPIVMMPGSGLCVSLDTATGTKWTAAVDFFEIPLSSL